MSYVAMYQKFRLIRERNQLEIKQVGYSSKLARIEKNITNKQKYYQGLFKKIEQQATNFKNQAKMGFQSIFGLGQGSVNPLNYSGTNGFVLNNMYQMLQAGVQEYDDKGNPVEGSKYTFDCDLNTAMMYYQQYGGPKQAYEDGKALYEDDGRTPIYEGGITAKDAQYLNMVFRSAQNNYQQAQMMMNQACTNYETNISIWQEAQEAQLQAEQDSVIGALEYEQTIMEIDNTYCEQRLARIKQEIESYDGLIKDRNEKNVPKFGLG